MKISILIRLLIGLSLAIFVFASALRASLEDILAPLPVAEVAAVEKPELRIAARTQEPESRKFVSSEARVESRQAADEILGADAILASDIHEAVVEKLQLGLRPSGKLSLVPLRDLPDLTAYSHPFNVHLVAMPDRLSRGNVMLRFQVENEKGVLGEWNLPFRVHLFSEVWYPRAHLRRGDLATPSDFEIRQVDLLAEPDAVPAVLESLLRHEYSRDIQPGQALVWKDLAERALVRKGDVVEVVAVQGLLAITMRAVARQDGANGDLIVLRNIDSAKDFSARVVGQNRVEVIF